MNTKFIVCFILCLTSSVLTQRLLEAESSAEEPKKNEVKCFWYDEETYSAFSLEKLKKSEEIKEDFTITTEGGAKVYFSFCGNTQKVCKEGEVSANQVIMEKSIIGINTCTKLAGDIEQNNVWKLLNATDPTEGFEIEFESGSICGVDVDPEKIVEKKYYKTKFLMKCNKWMESGKLNITKNENFDSLACEKIVEIESKESCPQEDLYAMWALLQKYKIFFGAALIIIGLFEVTLGAKLMIITLFIATCVVTITLVFFFIFLFFDPPIVVVWILLGITLVGGLVLGYFVAKHKRIVLGFLLGGYMGYILGILLYNLAFIHISANPKLIYWMTIIISMMLSCAFSYFLFNHILIVSTSFCGAYAFIRGISLYAGGFPNESYIIDLIRKKETDKLQNTLTPIVYAYLASWLIVCGIGIFVQYKFKNPNDKNSLNDDSKTSPLDEKSDSRDLNLNTSIGAINKI